MFVQCKYAIQCKGMGFIVLSGSTNQRFSPRSDDELEIHKDEDFPGYSYSCCMVRNLGQYRYGIYSTCSHC